MSDSLMLMKRCPDCGAQVAVPVTTKIDDDGSIILRVEEDEWVEIISAHVKFNPDIHPTFTKHTEDEDVV